MGRQRLWHFKFVLDRGSELACRQTECLDGCSEEQLIRNFAVTRGEEGHASWVVSCQLFGAASDRVTLEASNFVKGAFVELACSVPEGVVVGIEN